MGRSARRGPDRADDDPGERRCGRRGGRLRRSRLKGITIEELRLPVGAVVTLVVRDETSLVPDRHTAFRVGDRVLVVADASCRDAAKERIRAVAEHGRLARWRGPR